MRFDLVLNNLAGVAFTTGRIVMTSDGSPWRPLVHIRDISAAVVGVLEAPREAVAGEIFNVGDDPQNYRVQEIAQLVARVFPGCALEFGRSAERRVGEGGGGTWRSRGTPDYEKKKN